MVKQKGNSKLHFAAIRRVSTEQQEKTGESLRTQKAELEQAVKLLGGKISQWYGGQEHATPGYEKKEIDRLLKDSAKETFNAVIVANADRWSRDNRKSTAGLDIFKEHGIRFFVGTKEWDLFNPEHCLYLGMSSVIGQFYASNQKRKSLVNRINRAKRGIPTGGKLPYGRTFNKEAGKWEIDNEKKTKIEEIAGRYLAGESLVELAEEYKMNLANLHKILTKRAGTEWQLEFHSDDLKINEVVKMKIPRLLPNNIIEAIRKKADANRTYEHGHGRAKYQYLLGRRIFCGHCNYTMFGQTNHNGLSYYRHAHTKRDRKCSCDYKTWVRADEIEDAVMLHLFECFGNPKAVEKAIEKAIPNLDKIKEYEKQLEQIEQEIQKIKSSREKVLRYVVNDKISEAEGGKQLDELKRRETKLQNKSQQINGELANRPNPDKVKAVAKKLSSKFNATRRAATKKSYNGMSYEEKQALVELVFSGKTPDGRRMGVYVQWDKKGWKYDIHGQLIDKEALLPLSKGEKEARTKEPFHNIRKQRQLCAVIKNPLH